MTPRAAVWIAQLSLLSCCPLLPAQIEEPRADPAILLLTSSVPKLDPAALRAAVARAYPARPDVAFETDGAVVAFETGRVLVRLLREPVALTEKSMASVEDADAVARIRKHAGGWKLCLPGGSQERDARIQAHIVLGKLAAELLGPDCVAVGCVDFGVFEPAGEDTAELLRSQPMQALIPVKSSRVEVLLTAARRWREADLREAVAKGFGVEVPEQSAEGAPGRIWVNPTDATDARVVVHDKSLMLRLFDGPCRAVGAATVDERGRRAAERHRAWLLIAAFGKGGAAAERARDQAIGRMLAGLWGDECAAILWQADRRLIAGSPVTPVLLYSDDPVAATLAAWFPPPVGDATAMRRAVEEARTRWPEAAKFLAGGGVVHARFGFTAKPGHPEPIWARVFQPGDGGDGNAEASPDLLRLGESLTGKITELLDWVFVKDGQLQGGFGLKLQMAAIRDRKPAAHSGR